MAVATMKVPTIFTAVDRFSDVVSKMTNNVNRFGKTASSAINRVDHRINGLWGSMNSMSQLAIGGGVGGLFYYAGQDIMEYEKAIASAAAVTGTKIGSMNKDIESLGAQTGRSVIDITKGFEIVGSKMSQYLKEPKALREVVKQSILMAEASRMELEPAIDNLTSLLNQFGKGYESANFFVNKLSAGEDIGASTIPETIDILRQFAASARMAGADVTESIAMVQAVTKTLGKQGVGRNFRNIMVDLNTGKGMDKNKLRALSMVGINLDKMIDPATTFIEKMRELTKLSGNKQAMGMFFKKTGMEAGATFLRDFHYFETYLDFIKKTNSANEKAEKNMSTLARSIQMLKDRFTNLVVTSENSKGALGMVKNVIAWMIDNMQTLINLVLATTVAFLGWKAIVGVVALINGIMTAFNAIMSVHRFVVLWATMTNVSYAASLWAVAAATLAAYWPLLLIAGALGVLVYSMWDTKSATDAMVGSQISSLDKSNAAWMNSTNVMESQLSRQKKLLGSSKVDLPTPTVATGVLANVSKRKAENDAYIKSLPPMQKLSGKIFDENKTPVKVFNPNAELYNSNRKKNVAGSDFVTEQKIYEMMNSKGGKLDINLTAPEDYGMEVDDRNLKGIEVKTTKNQGSR